MLIGNPSQPPSQVIDLWLTQLEINHWNVLYKLCVFYVDRNSKMTTTTGHSFYIGPIGSFYNQVNIQLLRASGFKGSNQVFQWISSISYGFFELNLIAENCCRKNPLSTCCGCIMLHNGVALHFFFIYQHKQLFYGKRNLSKSSR